jgi:hypothetical protein
MDVQARNQRDWSATCEICGQTFRYPDFECSKQPGHHSLPTKTYYHLGGGHIQSIRDRNMFTPMLNLKADRDIRDSTGVIAHQDGLIVHFLPRGLYETSDPEEQYFLDHKNGVAQGPEGLKEWEKMYLTTDQQLTKAKAQLEETQRQIREGNALLDSVKEQKRPPLPLVAESPLAERTARDAMGVR